MPMGEICIIMCMKNVRFQKIMAPLRPVALRPLFLNWYRPRAFRFLVFTGVIAVGIRPLGSLARPASDLCFPPPPSCLGL